MRHAVSLCDMTHVIIIEYTNDKVRHEFERKGNVPSLKIRL